MSDRGPQTTFYRQTNRGNTWKYD